MIPLLKVSFVKNLIFKVLIVTLLLMPFSSGMVAPRQVYALSALERVLLNSAIEYAFLKSMVSFMNTEGGGASLISTYRKQYGVSADPAANAATNEIMQKLMVEANRDKPIQYPYKWFVNGQKDFNAFCSPGHVISINQGSFKELDENKDMIAFVLAHELGHGQRNHSFHKPDKMIPFIVLQSAFREVNQNRTVYSEILGILALRYMTAKNVTLPNEYEADDLSFQYAAGAGYNPGAGAALWQRMSERHGDKGKNFFGEVLNPSDHPTNSTRVKNLSQRLTDYSNGFVKVENGTINLNGEAWTKPAKSGTVSGAERAFMIGGHLAVAYKKSGIDAMTATSADKKIAIGDTPIMEIVQGDEDIDLLTNRLNNILKSVPVKPLELPVNFKSQVPPPPQESN